MRVAACLIGWLVVLVGMLSSSFGDEQRIDAARQVDLRVIVLDEHGQAAEGARVHIEQLEHEFMLGWTLPAEGWPDDLRLDERPWRLFNAVSLRRLTRWDRVSPAAGEYDWEAVEAAVEKARARGLRVHFGVAVPADAGRLPAWADDLDGAALREAARDHVDEVVRRYGHRVEQIDVYGHALGHDVLERRVGGGLVRDLYERGRFGDGAVGLGVQMDDGLMEGRRQQMLQRVTGLRERFVPVSAVSLNERIGNVVLAAPLRRTLAWLGRMEVEVMLSGLELGGESAALAATNLRTLLGELMAHGHVGGVWFDAVGEAEAIEPAGALVDGDGALTEVGRTLRELFEERWRSEERGETDELGNVRTRVFAGRYRVRAELPNGRSVTSHARIAGGEGVRTLVLEDDGVD